MGFKFFFLFFRIFCFVMIILYRIFVCNKCFFTLRTYTQVKEQKGNNYMFFTSCFVAVTRTTIFSTNARKPSKTTMVSNLYV